MQPARLKFGLLAGACLLVLGACGGEVEDTRPGQPVKTRQVAFKEMLRVFEPMGKMLRTDRYEADKFAALAAELLQKQEAPWSHFGPDTNYPPTKAKAEVWQQPAKFEEEKQAFFKATAALDKAAKSRVKADVQQAYDKTYEACKSCHRTFKEK